MGALKYAFGGNYKRFYDNLKVVGKRVHKNAFLMFIDAGMSTIFFGSGLTDYLNYEFYNKSFKQRRKYATIGYQDKFYKKASYGKGEEDFSNKILFHQKFKKFTNLDYYDYNDGVDAMKEFLKKHPICIEKPVCGLGGSNVNKIDSKTIKNYDEYYEKLVSKNLFLEEFAVQNKEWGKISPNSVNTLRVVTFALNGKSKIVFALARIGSGKSVVDNFHQGGTASLIDYEKGVLKGNGISKNLDEYEFHPSTKIKFDGYKVPYFEEVKKMCEEAALVNDSIHVVGWDVSITGKGPILIEGNNGPGFDVVQVVSKAGAKDIFEDMKKEMKEAGLW